MFLVYFLVFRTSLLDLPQPLKVTGCHTKKVCLLHPLNYSITLFCLDQAMQDELLIQIKSLFLVL